MMFWKTILLVGSLLDVLLSLPGRLLQYIQAWLHYQRLASRFPGPRPLPLVGNLLACGLRASTTTIFNHVMLKIILPYRTGQMWIGPKRCFFINDPRDLQCYYQNIKNQSKPFFTTKFVSEFMGEGLVSDNGEKWRRHHKIIAPTFHPDNINTFINTFNRKSDIFVELLCKYANGESFDLKPMAYRLAFDGVVETIFRVPSNELIHPDTALLEIIEEGQAALCHRLVTPWLHPGVIFYNFSSSGRKMVTCQKRLRDFSDKVIRQRKQILRENACLDGGRDEAPRGKKQICGVVDALLHHKEEGAPITDADIAGEVQTVLLAGFDTVAVTIQMVLYLLAKHPDVQDKVAEELRKVLAGDGSSEITLDMLHHMKYLEMVIKETHRMHPPSWVHGRQTGVDTPLVSCDLVIPAGSLVGISPKSLHSDPELYPNPDAFDPERFSPENVARRHPFAFLPFAAGARGCIARKFSMIEAKLILAKVLWNYEVKPEPTYTPDLTWGIAVVITNGMWLKLLRRR